MIQFRSIILEKLFLLPGASKLLPLDPLNTCSWTSFNYHLDQVINMFLLLYVCFLNWLKPSPAARLMPLQWQDTVRKCVSHLGYTFHYFQWSRHLNHWAIIRTLMKALQTSRNYHCPHHPQLSGKVERTNEIFKFKIFKLAETTRLPWPRCWLWSCWLFVVPLLGNKLTPYEIVTSRPLSIDIQLFADSLFSHANTTSYYKPLKTLTKYETLSSSFFFPLPWHWPAIIGCNLPDYWICHRRFWSIHNARDPLVLLLSISLLFSMSLQAIANSLSWNTLTELNFYDQICLCFVFTFLWLWLYIPS